MLETQLWSLSASCRRLIEETETLTQKLGSHRGAQMREVARLLADAQHLILDALDEHEHQDDLNGVVELTERMLRDDTESGAHAHPDLDQSPSPEHRRAMHSQSFFLPSAQLVTFLCGGRKTGVLRIRTDKEDFVIELRDGDIVHAHSDGAPPGERLGDILIERGVLTESELVSLLSEGTDSPLGARAIASSLASKAELRQALEAQIQRLFQRLFQATPTSFVFWEGPCLRAEDNLRLNSTMLLLDGARTADEQRRAVNPA